MESKKSIVLKEQSAGNTVMYGFSNQAECMAFKSCERKEFRINRKTGKPPKEVLYAGWAKDITKPQLKKFLDRIFERHKGEILHYQNYSNGGAKDIRDLIFNNPVGSFKTALAEIGNPKYVLIVFEKAIEVIILEGGKTALEINPFGKEPSLDGIFGKTPRWEGRSAADAPPAPIKNMKKWKLWCRWRMREEYLRTFDIDFSSLTAMFEKMEKIVGGKIQHVHFGYDVNTKRKAQIIERYTDSKIAGKVKILS